MSQTQTEQIKTFLLAGNTLTALESLDRFKCFRLGARCWDLRQAGYNVKSKMVETPSGKKIASYWIPSDHPLITPAEKKKDKVISISKLRSLAREISNGDLLTELTLSKLIVAAEKNVA